MAERRMFAKTIIDSDAFVDMPLSTQALYFHLSMRADDDGFINNPKKIQRMIGASDDDLKVLVMKRFIIPFESGIVVIKHWKIHNYIRNDRYKPTVYVEEKKMIETKGNGAYTECIQGVSKVDTIGIPNGNQMDTQYSIGKDRLVKDSIGKGSVEPATATAAEENQLKLLGGDLGKNVVYLTDRQLGDLMDRLGLDAFNRYVERLATFIIENNAHIKSHYDTILKWYEEDSKVSKKPKGKEKARYGDFDVNEAFNIALERSYGTEEKETI